MNETKAIPFSESTFVKVFLAFNILIAVIAIPAALLIGFNETNPSTLSSVLGILLSLISIATYVMAIIALVQWKSAGYPMPAVWFAVVRVVTPIVMFIISIVLSIPFMREAMNVAIEASESGSAAPIPEIPQTLLVLNWVGIVITAIYAGWAIYLLTLKEHTQ